MAAPSPPVIVLSIKLATTAAGTSAAPNASHLSCRRSTGDARFILARTARAAATRPASAPRPLIMKGNPTTDSDSSGSGLEMCSNSSL